MIKVVIKCSKWLSLSVVSLLFMLLLTLAMLLLTNPGLNLIVWGAEKALPQLSIESTDGAVLPRFTLNKVRFDDPQLNISTQARTLTLAINPACLTEPGVCVDELAIDGLNFSMPELPPSSDQAPQTSDPSSSSRVITSPIPISVARLALSNIELDILGHQIGWRSFTTGASFQGNRLRINKMALISPRVALADKESVEAQSTASSATNEPSETIELPEVVLPLQIELLGLDIRDFKLEQATPVIVNHLALVANAKQSQINVKNLTLDMPQVNAQLATNIKLAGDYPLTLSLNATVKEPVAKGQTVVVKASGSVADLDVKAVFDGLATGDIHAQLQPLRRELPFDVQLSDVDVQWPLTGQGEYFVALDSLQSRGSLEGYTLALNSEIKGQALPDLSLSLEGKGDLSHIELSRVDMATLGGSLTGDVMANWQAPINWAANLNISHIQPGLQWPDAEGDLSGSVSTTGRLTKQGGWNVELPKLDIDGLLRGYPLNIEGALSAADNAGNGELMVKTPRLVLSHGPNKIEAQGELGQVWQMDLAINFPEMIKTLPDLQGRARGNVKLRGALQAPEIGLNLELDAIDWQQQAQVEKVTLNGRVTPLPTPEGRLALKVTQAHYQDYTVDDLRLNLNGSQQAHDLILDVSSNIASTQLTLSGALDDKPELAWRGDLKRMQLSSKQGEWRLAQSTALAFDMATEQVSVAAHCWQQAGSTLCLDKDINVGQSGEATLSLEHFNFDQIAMLIPKQTVVAGQVNAQVTAKWAPDLPPYIKAALQLPKGQVTQELEQAVSIGWESVALNALLDNNQLQADWLFDVTDNGDVSGNVAIANVLSQDKQLDGRLQLTTFNLDFLAPLIGEFSQLKSNISTDLAITGPALQPQVKGRFVVDDIKLKGEISPVEIESGRVLLNFDGYQASLAAALNTPDGQLELSGDADWQNMQDWSTNVRVYAQELLVDLPPMVKIKVQPDMTISATPNYARIDGDIALPWGRILVEELPSSAVGVSKDQVILNQQLEPIDEQSSVPFAVETDINIKIGDDFKLSAFGLEGGLVGQLNVAQKDKGSFVTGEINITDGSYRSFGQDLLINEGKILMNGPVDQPYVQISAIRNPENTRDDVTAGVKVSGPASEPTVTIFSEPAMPQANALSYLLRGQDIDGETGGNAMTTTLIGLSLAKSGRVVGEIGEAFGVQDLQLDTAGSGDDSQVTVSGYILPGLQVKYGVGIFDSVGEFTVRYRLMQDLYLEAMSGVDSAVDVLYQFEFD
ncbi:translocation/assembly module TamB domain-containing protein [Vibrio sp. NH-UV-68]|uniref:autotransporter assembly complex protein TamB n=1 Tax=unclassified Vibrio TaxID=2614977 RepID=UPI0036F34420